MKTLMVGLIRLYQRLLSPLIPPCCRYSPTCSHYAIDAVRKHGAIAGGIMAAARILRCAPWGGYGMDAVPEHFSLRQNREVPS